MLNFKVFSGNMYCGTLSIVSGFSHNFLNRDNHVICSSGVIDKIKGYKHLKLVKI